MKNLLTIICIISAISICGEVDTLSYFNEEYPLDIIIVLASVSDLGVRFSPDTNWSQYNIIEIDFLTPESFPNWMYFEISTADGEDEFPGTVLNSYPVIFNDTTAQHPHWYSVDVSSHESMQNLSGDFWVTGSANFMTLRSTNPNVSGHTFAYVIQAVPCAPCWVGPNSDITLRAVIAKSDSSLSTIKDRLSLINEYSIQLSNYPNPFNPTTTIQYDLPHRSEVQITIFDLLGRKVTTLMAETQDAGYRSIQWDAAGFPSGMYFYQIRAGEYVQTRKTVLLK